MRINLNTNKVLKKATNQVSSEAAKKARRPSSRRKQNKTKLRAFDSSPSTQIVRSRRGTDERMKLRMPAVSRAPVVREFEGLRSASSLDDLHGF